MVESGRYGRRVDPSRKSRLESDISAVADGQTTGLTVHVGPDGTLPVKLRQLKGLRQLRLVGAYPIRLPGWLEELGLRVIDARFCRLAAMPPLPWVQWALTADDLLTFRALIDPAQVYGVLLDPGAPRLIIENLAELARAGRIPLTELRVTSSDHSDRPPDSPELERALDEIIAGCPDLRVLVIETPAYRQLGESIRNLGRLTWLVLDGMSLPGIPAWVFELSELLGLEVLNAGLSALPPTLGSAAKLRLLSLAGNRFTEIPAGVWHLPRLATLSLSRCPITEIPAEILRLDSLEQLTIDTEELTVPPPEVAARGLEAIRSYWKQEQVSGMDYLTEAKLLVVGEAGAGKTSLIRKILEPGYALDPIEESTQGIDVREWRFPAAIRIAGDDGDRLEQRPFRVNIWDFGGQEIYHSTHQFFLTKRSVYVLVSDGRREDTDFQYWLDVVNLLSDGSPLIIVQNRKQGRGQTLDLQALRQGYPHVVAQLDVDLADNSGLAEVVVRARRELELLAHIGTPLPKTWQSVRLALEEDPRDHIAADEFFRICAGAGFRHEDDMRQLGGFLHDLGICLYFQDDPLLRRTIILKPEWGTAAVYRVLDDEAIRDAHGVFGPADLDRIWPEPTYRAMRDELVRLMVRFSLCFPVPDSDQHVAPQLLSPARPGYVWDEPGDLLLRYEYEVMPKGIVRRLIVALHDLIEDNAVWRHGVVLRFEDGRAEVVEDFHRRCLTIRLAGDLRGMLALIDRALAAIHRSYPEIRFDRLRPCACAVCLGAPEPTMFRVRDLEDFARTGDEIQCRASRRLVDPVALLSELWRLPSGAAVAPPSSRSAEVFVSYKWGGAAEEEVDRIDARLTADGMRMLRDKREVGYRDSIQRFMRRLGGGKFVVVVLDDAYLRSRNCMFELTEMADREDYRKCVFPIVLGDANIYDPIGRIGYVRYWEQETARLEQEMRTVSQRYLEGIRQDLDLYSKIRDTIAGITGVLRDMNTFTARQHADENFAQLSRAIEQAHTRERAAGR
jgi:internalin A